MGYDQEIWAPWSSAADLLRAAAEQGTPVTERLIVDWTERGLLDRPRSKGLGYARGREKGVWPWSQRQLFLSLLRKRPAKRSQFPALFNIPVFLWLFWGESYVPIDQARRCLLSWHRRLGPTSQKDARRAARQTVKQIAHRDASREARRALAEHLQEWAVEGDVYPGDIRRLVTPVIDPHRTGQTRGPIGGQFTAETYLTVVEARIMGEVYLTSFEDEDFKQARTFYLRSRRDYARGWRRLAADQDLGHMFEEPTLDSVVNHACTDLTIILGLIQRGGRETAT
jgi:hypothetical protein